MKKTASSFSLSSKRKILASIALALLVGGYAALFFVPGVPGNFWMRFLLAFLFSLLMGTSVFFIIKKRLTAEDIAYIKDEENFARAVRAMKQTKFYTQKLPGFPKGIRKEIRPAAITGFVLFLLMLIVSPCRPPEAPMPDFSKMAAQEFYYPHLFAASDSMAILAPPVLSAETEAWAGQIPPRYLEWTMYAEMFGNHFETANANGNLCETKTSGVLLAMAQASMLAGQYERAVLEYQEVLDSGNADPAVAFQQAIAIAYAGRLKDAVRAMKALDAKKVAEAIGDDLALRNWLLVLQILQGDLGEETISAYASLYRRQSGALAKLNETQGAAGSARNSGKSDSGKSDSGKGDSGKGADPKTDAAAQNELAARRLLERRVASSAANMAVLQIFQGDFMNAVPTANAALLLSRNAASRSAKIMRLCAFNTKGYACGFLGSRFDDPAKEWDEVFTAPEGYFGKVRSLYEEILAASRLETDAVNPASKKAPFSLLPWCAEVQFALTNRFTSEAFPDEKAFQQKYEEPLTLASGLHKIWSANETRQIPLWAIPVENLLMRESLILEGIDKDDNFQIAVRVSDANLQKENALPLLATRMQRMEIQLLGRFAAREALTISMLETLLDDQKKIVRLTENALPENHPMIGRQALATLRLTLIKKSLSKKDFGTVQAALNRARTVLGASQYPADSWLMNELGAAERLTDALKLKKKDASEIQAAFEPAIRQTGSNRFWQSFVYRDLGFALQHHGFTTEADAANRSARTIFNQQIFRSNTRHFLILQMDKILKH